MAASIEAPTLRTVSSLLAKKEEKVEKKEEVKNESDPVIKKQKTEWAAALKKLPGDVSFCKDCPFEILDYLSHFTERTPSTKGTVEEPPHPCELVVHEFKDPETAALTYTKLHTFLEEALKADGSRLAMAARPATNFADLPPGKHHACSVPLQDIIIALPPDGLPCTQDWMTCVLSFLFSGSRLYREPLDLYIQKNAAPDVSEPRLGVKKGFTRLNLDEIIPCLDLIKPLLPAITDLFCIPSTISPPQDTELTSFDAIQLSTQGAERQRKDVMKMAMRIEILLAERKAAGGVSDQSDKDLIMEIIGRYNDHKANSAIRRWDYSQDLDAILMSKPASLQVEQISMWQDHVGNVLAKSSAVLTGLQRRMLQDSKLDGKDPDKVHHVGYCDLSKWGRLSVPLIDEVSSWAARTLQLNPEMSMVLIICPMLAGEGILHGLRGEFRRIEDKLDSLQLALKVIQVLFDAAIDLMGELQSDTYLGVFSETANSTLAQYVTTQVKDKLLNDWKQGTGLMAAAQPKFIQTADTSEFTKPR
ncbi:unnamed protein product, partial [Durusdinium trenchii]